MATRFSSRLLFDKVIMMDRSETGFSRYTTTRERFSPRLLTESPRDAVTNQHHFTAFSYETGAVVTVSAFEPLPIDLLTLEGLSGSKYNFYFSDDAPRSCRLTLNEYKAGNAPSGFVRKMLCKVLHLILTTYSTIGRKDGIYLLACGKLRGSDYTSLLSLYQKMGFSVVAQEKTIETPNCYTYMSAPIGKLVHWCSTIN